MVRVSEDNLNELDFKEIGVVVMDSLNYTLPITISYSKEGRLLSKIGIVDNVEMKTRKIKLDLLSSSIEIPIDCIRSVERIGHDTDT